MVFAKKESFSSIDIVAADLAVDLAVDLTVDLTVDLAVDLLDNRLLPPISFPDTRKSYRSFCRWMSYRPATCGGLDEI